MAKPRSARQLGEARKRVCAYAERPAGRGGVGVGCEERSCARAERLAGARQEPKRGREAE